MLLKTLMRVLHATTKVVVYTVDGTILAGGVVGDAGTQIVNTYGHWEVKQIKNCFDASEGGYMSILISYAAEI